MISVLYVDDETDLLEIGKIFLERSPDFHVTTSESAAEALSLLDESSFDVILSDFQMPEMDGISFLKEVRRRGNLIPFIFFTGKGREEVVIDALNAGATSYVQKGGDPKSQFIELEHRIRNAVERQRAGEALRKSEERYRSLFENMLHGFAYCRMIYDDRGRPADFVYINVNCAFERLTGSKNVVGKRVTDVIPGIKESIPKLFEVYGRVALTGIPEEFEIDFKPLGLWLSIKVYSPEKGYFVAVFDNITEQKKTALALRESAEKWQKLFSILPLGVSVVNARHETVDFNPALTEIVGIPQEGLINKKYDQRKYLRSDHSIIPPQEFPSIRAINEQKSIRGVVIGVVIEEGSIIWTEVSAAPLALPEAAAVVVTSDITERKQAEEELQKSEERLMLVLKGSNDAWWDCDYEKNEAFYSPRWWRMLGYAPGELPADPDLWRRLSHPNDLEKVDRIFNTAIMAGRESFEVELRLLHKDGHHVPVRSRGFILFDKSNNPIRVSGMNTDLNERKKAEAALRESEERLSLAIAGADLGTWDWDIKTGKVVFNDRWAEMLGYSLSEIKPDISTWESHVHPDDMTQIQQVLNDHLNGKTALYETEHRLLTKSGGWIWVLDKGKVIERDPNGHPLRATGTHLDITEKKRAEEALIEVNRKLNLLSSITRHDINNQLTVLLGYLALLRDQVHDPALAGYFSRIENAGERISAMIRFTKTYENIGVHAPEWQEIHTIVEHVASDAPLGEVRVVNDIPAGIEIFVDPLIVKVFYNLMENAVRYGEKITTIRFSIEERKRNLIIVCRDDGDGIPNEAKDKIFNLGYGKNTGLGLCLTKEILSITGISINEAGESGAGARFEMIVPQGTFRTKKIDTL